MTRPEQRQPITASEKIRRSAGLEVKHKTHQPGWLAAGSWHQHLWLDVFNAGIFSKSWIAVMRLQYYPNALAAMQRAAHSRGSRYLVTACSIPEAFCNRHPSVSG